MFREINAYHSHVSTMCSLHDMLQSCTPTYYDQWCRSKLLDLYTTRDHQCIRYLVCYSAHLMQYQLNITYAVPSDNLTATESDWLEQCEVAVVPDRCWPLISPSKQWCIAMHLLDYRALECVAACLVWQQAHQSRCKISSWMAARHSQAQSCKAWLCAVHCCDVAGQPQLYDIYGQQSKVEIISSFLICICVNGACKATN